jgi:hypothetical protein
MESGGLPPQSKAPAVGGPFFALAVVRDVSIVAGVRLNQIVNRHPATRLLCSLQDGAGCAAAIRLIGERQQQQSTIRILSHFYEPSMDLLPSWRI